MKCYRARGVLIPGCWSKALDERAACTCYGDRQEKIVRDPIEARLELMEKLLRDLVRRLADSKGVP